MRIRVKFSLYLPEGTSGTDVEEWLKYQLGINGMMSEANPLSERELRDGSVSDFDWQER